MERTYMDSDGEIILCNCIRMLPVYSDENSSCKFTVDQGRVLIFKERGEWKMKHKLGHKYETMWYTTAEWSNVDNGVDLFKPDPLDIDVYYLLYKDELSATLTVDDRFADFHQYVNEILEAGVKMICMMNTDVHCSKRSKKSKDFHMNKDIFDNISRIRKNDVGTNDIISIIRKNDVGMNDIDKKDLISKNDVGINDIYKKKDLISIKKGNFIDPRKSISKKWTWDDVTVGKKRVPVETICNVSLRKDIHRIMVELFLPHFQKKIRSVRDGKRDVDDTNIAPDQMHEKYIGDTSSFYVSRASMYVN